MKPDKRAVTGAAALVLLLVWVTLRPDITPVPPAPSVRGGPGATPNEFVPGPALDDDASPEADDCDAERGELEARLRAATDELACAADLLAHGCVAELPPNDIYPSPEQVASDLEQALSMCPPESRQHVVADCSEFPCLVLVHRDALHDPACLPLQQIADTFGQEPPGDGVEATHVTIPATGRHDISDHEAIVGARWEARKHLLARRLATPPNALLLAPPPCREVRAQLAQLDQGPDCDVVRQARGCRADEPVYDPVVVEEHLDAARALVDELERTCPTFRDHPHALDCTELPCVLAIDVTDTSPDRPVVVCDHPVWGNLDTYTASNHTRRRCGPTVIVPLWDVADLLEREPVVEDRYVDQRSFRMSESCQAVERLRDPP